MTTDISRITDYLFISSLPIGKHTQGIYAQGVRFVISMSLRRAPIEYRRPPFRFIHLPTFDSPITPIPIFMLRRGVYAATPVIAEGGGVLVHCRAGVHRSVAMAACILISQGHSANDAMKLIKERRGVADPYVGYIQSRIHKFEQDWGKRQGKKQP